MKGLRILLPLAALAMAGCASTEYQTYEGRTSIFEGQGGTKTVVDGIEFWENGEPPRRFQLLGIVTDERPSGLIPMARLKGDIAKKAKEQKADAVILLSSGSRLLGTVHNASGSATVFGNTASASATGTSVPILKNSARFAIIRYVE